MLKKPNRWILTGTENIRGQASIDCLDDTYQSSPPPPDETDPKAGRARLRARTAALRAKRERLRPV